MPYIFPPPPPPSQPAPMSQTMLLTKRLTTFLSQNASPQLPTLLLLSPTGKLLSTTSPLPASSLRTQATLACSLWTLYHPIPSHSSSALPHTTHSSNPRSSESTISSTTTATEHDLRTVTIQLSNGVMVIRALSCGLLFVALGPSLTNSTQTAVTHQSLPGSPDAHESASLKAGSENGSIGSTGGQTKSIMAIRRQAEEVGKWLDGQLEGFVLSSSDGR